MNKPNRVHPKCQDLGCRSYEHLVCPVECELLHRPEPEETTDYPLSVLQLAPTLAIT